MVAGMVMPLADLRAIYELLFKDGVIVVKKDKRPTSIHPDIEGVTNLKVLRAMGSLKSRGYVRETFAWKHAYCYLTNEGIVYVRDFLHLPPEIVPATLQRIHPSASSARVQTAKGSKGGVSKPQSERNNEEGKMDRHVYRHKREESDRRPRNLGQALVQNRADFTRKTEELWAEGGHGTSVGAHCFSTKDRSTRCHYSIKKACSSVVQKMPPRVLQESVTKTSESGSAMKVPDERRGKTLNISREVVPNVVVDLQTDPLLVENSKKEPKHKEDVLEKVMVPDVVTIDVPEEPPCDVLKVKQLNVEVFSSMMDAKTTDHDSVAPRKVMKKTVHTAAMFQLHVASEASSSSSTKTDLVAPSEGPAAALNFPPLHEDLMSLTGDPEMDPGVRKTCSDSPEGWASSSSFLCGEAL